MLEGLATTKLVIMIADTAHCWMTKCNAGRIGNNKTYYNDHHENSETKVYRIGSFNRLFILHKRMKVWYLASEADQAEYLLLRESSEAKIMFPIGEKYVDDDGCFFGFITWMIRMVLMMHRYFFLR